MVLFQWSEQYSVGVEEFDEHHKKMFNMIGELHEALKNGTSAEYAGRLVEQLKEYAHYHFTAEERAMEGVGYHGLAAQQDAHAHFLETVREHEKKIAAGKGLISSMELSTFLRDWLMTHIKMMDKEYESALKKR